MGELLHSDRDKLFMVESQIKILDTSFVFTPSKRARYKRVVEWYKTLSYQIQHFFFKSNNRKIGVE